MAKFLKLKKSREFDKVFTSGKKFYIDKIATIYFLITQNPDISLGIITGKRIGKAVWRNKLKRTLQEIIRNEKNKLCPGLSLIIIPKKSALGHSFSQLKNIFLNYFRKQGIYPDDKS